MLAIFCQLMPDKYLPKTTGGHGNINVVRHIYTHTHTRAHTYTHTLHFYALVMHSTAMRLCAFSLTQRHTHTHTHTHLYSRHSHICMTARTHARKHART